MKIKTILKAIKKEIEDVFSVEVVIKEKLYHNKYDVLFAKIKGKYESIDVRVRMSYTFKTHISVVIDYLDENEFEEECVVTDVEATKTPINIVVKEVIKNIKKSLEKDVRNLYRDRRKSAIKIGKFDIVNGELIHTSFKN